MFYQASLFGGSGSLGQIASFVFDGENTATAGVDVAQGVEVYSGSGVFLGFGADPNAVPVPATIALLSAGVDRFQQKTEAYDRQLSQKSSSNPQPRTAKTRSSGIVAGGSSWPMRLRSTDSSQPPPLPRRNRLRV